MPHLLLGALVGALTVASVQDPASRVESVVVVSHGARLAGSIVWPNGRPLSAAVVFIHGSGPQRRDLALARRFAARGIAALVYDKRGVGESGGTYEGNQSVTGMNISLLADDAAAALAHLSTRLELGDAPIGFAGISQAGWIAPLAATRSPRARFLLLWSAPVCRVSEEDIYSKYTKDADGPDRPPYATALSSRAEQYIWPDFLGRDTNSSEDLATLSIPGFWIFGGYDGSIPVDLSLRNLNALRTAGHRFDYVVSAAEGHNNMTATFDAAIEWIERTVSPRGNRQQR